MNLNDYFVSFKVAKKLKAIGFDEECIGAYEHNSVNNTTSLKYYLSSFAPIPSIYIEPMAKLMETRSGMFKSTYKNSSINQFLYAAPLNEQLREWFFKVHKLRIESYMSNEICPVVKEIYHYHILRHNTTNGSIIEWLDKKPQKRDSEKESLEAAYLECIDLIKSV